MADDLEQRLKALEEAQERRHAELLARLERPRGVGVAAQEARAAMRRGYAAADAERAAAAAAEGDAA